MKTRVNKLVPKPRIRRLPSFAVLLVVSAGLLPPTMAFGAKKQSASLPRTYTVMVGLEQPHKGIGVNAYFPETVTIHVGDTVHWLQNSNEIHTVTFLDGEPLPELLLPSALVPGADPAVSPLVFNPAVVNPAIPLGGEYTGGPGAYANSGIMGREPGQVGEFDLTFAAEGTFAYVCVVHGFVMSGEVVVVGDDQVIASPNQVMAEGRKQMNEALSLIPGVVRDAAKQVMPPEVNPDGTTTHHVLIGYADGPIDLMQFFPDKLTVQPGDTVIWEMSPDNDAPHTVTFLNGAEEPSLGLPDGGLLYINPEVLLPGGGTVLDRSEIFSAGLMPPVPGTSYSLVIGDIKPGLLPFLCLLHDTSGMKGELMVIPQSPDFDEGN